MKTTICIKGVILASALMLIFTSCSKEEYPSDQNDLLKQVKINGIVVEEISYNSYNLVSEVNGTSFWRKFYYNDKNKLIKEESAINPERFSSATPATPSDEFVDPDKIGISMSQFYEYDNDDRLIRQLNYIPEDGQFELRSVRTFEYNERNLISKALLHDSNGEVTHFKTYLYDGAGNVKEVNFYSYLFIPEGAGPKHLWKTTYEYDSYFNPYKIFEQSANPGINTNLNNIIKTHTINYDPVAGFPVTVDSETSYEYDKKTRFPVRVVDGEEFIY